MRIRAWLSAAALSATFGSASFAQIAGKVTLEGNPPDMPEIKGISANPQCAGLHKDPVYEDTVVVGDKGELANAFVFIREDKEGELKGTPKETPVIIDQKGCMYAPHAIAVQTGQPVVVKNSDPFLHNVHSLAIDNPTFNFAQLQGTGDKKLDPFTAVETFQIKCDVHPWMKAVVRVFDNPYFAVSGEDGKFSIDTKGLKDGSYTVQAWHELYHDAQPQKIEVKNGKADKDLTFTYKAAAGKAQAAPLTVIHLAAAQGGAAAACCDAPKPAAVASR